MGFEGEAGLGTNAVVHVERRDVPLMLHLCYMAQQLHPVQVPLYNVLHQIIHFFVTGWFNFIFGCLKRALGCRVYKYCFCPLVIYKPRGTSSHGHFK